MKAKIRAAAGITAAAIGAVTLASVFAADSYPHDYTIENILSDYIFFTPGNLDANTHIVGAVAVGGDGSIGSYGEGMIIPSYINNVKAIGNCNHTSWVGENQVRKLYYNTSDPSISMDQSVSEKYDGYIDFSQAMAAINAQSKDIADKGYQFTSSDLTDKDLGWLQLKYLTIDVSDSKYNGSKSFTIPYSIYKDIDVINFVDSENSGFSQEDLAHGGYTISINGVGDNPIEIGYRSGNITNKTSESLAAIHINDQNIDFSEVARAETDPDLQINTTGINFMLNLPDASGNVHTYNPQGGIVAPNASVDLSGGTLEGTVIGGSIYTNNEAHFYPYYPLGVRNRNDGGSTTTTTTTNPTTTTTTTNPTTTTTTTKPTTTTTTTKPTTTTTTTKPTTTTTTTKPTTTTTTAKPTTTTTTTKPTTTTTTTKPTTTTTTTKPTTTTTTTKPTTTTTTTKPTTTTTTTKPTTTTTTTKPTTTTTTTKPTTTTTTTKPTTTTTSSNSGLNSGNNNKNTSASKANNAASAVSPNTGAGYTSIAVVSLLTASAAIALGKKRFNDKDKD